MLDTKGYIVYNSTYMTFWKTELSKVRSVVAELGVGKRLIVKGIKKPLDEEEMSYEFIVVVTFLHVNFHQIIYLKWVNFTLSTLTINLT